MSINILYVDIPMVSTSQIYQRGAPFIIDKNYHRCIRRFSCVYDVSVHAVGILPDSLGSDGEQYSLELR